MRRPASRPVSVTRRTVGDTSQILVRAGDRELGAITHLGSEADDTLSGNFANRPAFVDFTAVFHELARALESNDASAIAARRKELADLNVEVWHKAHDMRIDDPNWKVVATA